MHMFLFLLLIVVILLSIINESHGFVSSSSSSSSSLLLRKITKTKLIPNDITSSILLSDEDITKAVETATGEVSRFSQVDKTGVIGFFADGIEKAIDLVHSLLNGVGVEYSYGIAIIILTCLSKYNNSNNKILLLLLLLFLLSY